MHYILSAVTVLYKYQTFEGYDQSACKRFAMATNMLQN